jgi:UDP-N-acetylglucosamine 4,6-dehydratase
MLKNFLIKKPDLNNKTILVTGGTGSFGNQFVQTIIDNYAPKKLIIFQGMS